MLKTGVVFPHPEGVRFGEEEDDIARLVIIGIAARNNEQYPAHHHQPDQRAG